MMIFLLYARICKITDVYDALTTRRCYKKTIKTLEALTIMKSHGTFVKIK